MIFDLELTGRRALVTAGTKGVGAAVVDVLRNAGTTVVATARAIPAEAFHCLITRIEAQVLRRRSGWRCPWRRPGP